MRWKGLVGGGCLEGEFGDGLLCVGLVFDDEVDHFGCKELAEFDIKYF
jgi:hypothetical protein